MLPHQQRVVDEANDLVRRAHKLSLFVSGPEFDALHDVDKSLLLAQLGVMSGYISVLSARLTFWGLDVNKVLESF